VLGFIEFSEICDSAGIKIPAPSLGIGRELTYLSGARRTIIVHFAQSDFPGVWKNSVFKILSLKPSWILINRFGDFEGQKFLTTELDNFVDVLAEKYIAVSKTYDDLYIVSDDGQMIISYSHSMLEEGLVLSTSNIDLAGEVLVCLNALGSELELISISS
jgi:hypothetical protein